MQQTALGLFDEPARAERAVQALASAGVPRERIVALSAAAEHVAALARSVGLRLAGEAELQPALEKLGVPPAQARLYARGLRQGGVVLLVRCGGRDPGLAWAVLRDSGALDLQEHPSDAPAGGPPPTHPSGPPGR